MTLELKLRKIGKSVGVILPKEVLARLDVEPGDALYLTENSDGSFLIRANDVGPAQKMKVAEKLSRTYGNALKELAKGKRRLR